MGLDTGRHSRLLKRALPFLAATFITACGGGDGDGNGTPPASAAPTFTSPATASANENDAGTVYQAIATTAKGGAITYTIGGGTDAARFVIDANGALRFAIAPNFDLPADANGDNVYEVDVVATAGQSTTTQRVAITVANSREGIQVQRIATGFAKAVAIAPIAGGSQLLVAEEDGAIYRFNPQTNERILLYTVGEGQGQADREVRSIVPASDFATTGSFFVLYSVNDRAVIVERYLRNPAGPYVPDNFGPLLSMSCTDYLGGGWLGLDRNGRLLAAIGDADIGAGARGASDPASRFGKLLRFDPNPDPFAGASPQFFRTTVLGSGLREPNGGFLSTSGLLFADQGESAEEINLLPFGAIGPNYGWPFRDATRTIREGAPSALTDPILTYPHGDGPRAGDDIVGGVVGTTGSLTGQYLFADEEKGMSTVPFTALSGGAPLTQTALERRSEDFVADTGKLGDILAISAGSAGAIYILNDDGEIFSVTAS